MTIGSHEDYKTYLEADLASHGLDSWGYADSIRYPAVYYQRLLRRIEYRRNCGMGPWGRIELMWLRWRRRRLGFALGLQIPPNVCGPGLCVVHHGLIIINSRAKIGEHCRIHSGVNIGQWRGEAPCIGDDVYIGPGAKILGGITVGDRVVIGANAVVSKDVRAGVTVGGVPAELISEKDSTTVS